MRTLVRTLPLVLASVLILVHPARAEDRKLTGSEIRVALTGRSITGKADGIAWTQSFAADGGTRHAMGDGSSIGQWDIRGDQYCPLWPPGQQWRCYDVRAEGKAVIFVSPDGERSVGMLTP